MSVIAAFRRCCCPSKQSPNKPAGEVSGGEVEVLEREKAPCTQPC
jgi:hypothetical protein